MTDLQNIQIHVVDDDESTLLTVKVFLEEFKARVTTHLSSKKALQQIIEAKPDLVILDLMMPELDGMDMIRLLREEPQLQDMKIVIFSAKPYEQDRQRALDFGADGYITKPFLDETFIKTIKGILEDQIELTYWGVRGTLPVPGEGSLKYGGNTNCLSIQFPKENLFIFDAGTGIKGLSDHLLANQKSSLSAKILISHPHWDHINALPFFVPLYIPGNEFEVFGASHGNISMRELISAQMDGVYFPIRIKEFAARTYFRDLKEEQFEIGNVKVSTMLLSHPGTCLGYRLNYKDRSVCYITDNELFPEGSISYDPTYWKKLTSFIQGTHVLITDSTYTDEEYETKKNWGHSSISQVVKLAHEAQVKELHLIHHDPDQNDADIDAKLATAKKLLKKYKSQTVVIAPRESETFSIT